MTGFETGTPQDTPDIDVAKLQQDMEIMQKRVDDSQTFITQLKEEKRAQDQEIQELRTLSEKATALEQVLQTPQHPEAQPETTSQPSADEIATKAAELATQTIQSMEQERVHEQNFAATNTKLVETYGDKCNDVVTDKAASLGMSFDDALDMAKRRPKVFETLFIDNTTQAAPQPTSGVETPTFNTPPQDKPKSIMFGASTKDTTAAWRRIKDSVQ